ncbi:uncharacterized protein LOC124645991 [Helicoverpa zea]|uniref:uncharacterized protein LOC124645991 n=1 Tax=Helicoverpa zea TaxID=7113 RepID=UPI001F56D356|nr:uncharacterized protein LOC124645991 [Helicoverpa zea]
MPAVGGGVRRDVSVYRRGSGTLCFRTLRAPARPLCSCAPPHCSRTRYNQGSNAGHESKEVQVPPPPMQHERTSTASEHDTYTVDKQSRATSPDSTEFEITYLSDLPLEKEKASPMKSRPFSPGEDKTTTTYTDSSCSPDTNYTLSEGEMPICSNSKRKYSHDRDGRNGRQMNGTLAEPAEKPCEKIESALQAVTDEIARCNTLLKAHRPTPASQVIILNTNVF